MDAEQRTSCFGYLRCRMGMCGGETAGRGSVRRLLASLKVGDLVEVGWLDASEGRVGSVDEGVFDVPVRSMGFYAGVHGRRTKHVIILKEIFEGVDIHYNSIPVGMIEAVCVHRKGALSPEALECLKPVISQI
jgi:hypothetical protein